jgi:hypothetical protein
MITNYLWNLCRNVYIIFEPAMNFWILNDENLPVQDAEKMQILVP